MTLPLLRLFQPVAYDGDCSLKFASRNEEVHYFDADHTVSFERTHCSGQRLYPATAEWVSARPSRAEQARVLSNVLLFLGGRNRRKTTVVLNPDDPRVELWEAVCLEQAELIAAIEHVSDADELEYTERMTLENIDNGGSAQFGENGTPTTDKQVVRDHYARLAQETEERRARERRDFDLER